MKFRLDAVPATFDNAIQEVLLGLTSEERAQLHSLNGSELSGLNLTLGLQIRGAWSLWDENTPLALDCKRRGLPSHPETTWPLRY